MSIEQSLERIAKALEMLHGTRMRCQSAIDEGRKPKAEEPEEPKAEEPKAEDRESIKLQLVNAGVDFNTRASTKSLQALLNSVKSGAVPEDALAEEGAAPVAPIAPIAPSYEDVKTALVEYVKTHGRDAGVAKLVEAGANADGPKLSQLDDQGRSTLMEVISDG